MRSLRIVLLALAVFLAPLGARAQVVESGSPILLLTPGYKPNYFYSSFGGPTSTASPVLTLGTVVYLYQFSLPDSRSLSAVSLAVRTVTGASGCIVKLAVFANSPITFRATGTALAGSNTEQSCATNSTNQIVSISYTFQPYQVYWVAAAFNTAAPNMLSIGGSSGFLDRTLGRQALGNTAITGVSAPFVYGSDNIMTKDLTGVTFTDQLSVQGIPVVYLGCASVC